MSRETELLRTIKSFKYPDKTDRELADELGMKRQALYYFLSLKRTNFSASTVSTLNRVCKKLEIKTWMFFAILEGIDKNDMEQLEVLKRVVKNKEENKEKNKVLKRVVENIEK